MHRARRLILHIGAPRTGSTAIQIALGRSRASLLKAGVLYPNCLGNRFVAAMAPIWPADPARHRLRIKALAVPRVRREIAEALRREIDDARPEVIFVSAEQFFDRLDTRSVRRRLHALLAPLAERVEVLVYLRRQDQAIFSRYWNSVRLGRPGEFVPPVQTRRMYDYERRLRPWAALFGAEAMTVRPHQAGSSVQDVMGFLGVPETVLEDAALRKNPSLDAVRASFVQKVAAHLDDVEDPGDLRQDLTWAIDEVVGNWPSPVLPAGDARAILDLYEPANQRLDGAWGGGAPFFDRTVREVEVEEAALGVDDVIEISAQLWVRKARQVRRLRRQLNQARGKQGDS